MLFRSAENSANSLARVITLATARTLDQFKIQNLPEDLGSTGFAAMDSSGLTAACAITMNGPFGSGHTIEGTGVTLARANQTASATTFLTPAILTKDGAFVLAAAGAGGPNGTASVVSSLLLAVRGVAKANIRTTGFAPYDTMNAILCENGTCYAIPDRGAYGLAKAIGG